MIPKDVDQITEADLHALIASGREEGVRIDFKRDLPALDKDGKVELIKDVCAFANTEGGDLVYGIDETEGVASTLVPQRLPVSADAYVLQITNVLNDAVEPRLFGIRVSTVRVGAEDVVLVIRVPRSSSGLHRPRQSGHFHVRRSRSVGTLDVPGLLAKVSDYLGRQDRVDAFFSRRYADILTNRCALDLSPSPKLVIYFAPPGDFTDGTSIDIINAKSGGVPVFGGRGYSEVPTYEGRAFYDAAANGVIRACTSILHNGVVEAIASLDWTNHSRASPCVNIDWVEKWVFNFIGRTIKSGLLPRTTGLPFIARVAIVGANDIPGEIGDEYLAFHFSDQRRTVQRLPVLAPSGVLIDTDIQEEWEHLVATVMLRIWQAWGFESSPHFNLADGKWTRAK